MDEKTRATVLNAVETLDKLETVIHLQWPLELTLLTQIVFLLADLPTDAVVCDVLNIILPKITTLIFEVGGDALTSQSKLLARCGDALEKSERIKGLGQPVAELVEALVADPEDMPDAKLAEVLETLEARIRNMS